MLARSVYNNVKHIHIHIFTDVKFFKIFFKFKIFNFIKKIFQKRVIILLFIYIFISVKFKLNRF